MDKPLSNYIEDNIEGNGCVHHALFIQATGKHHGHIVSIVYKNVE